MSSHWRSHWLVVVPLSFSLSCVESAPSAGPSLAINVAPLSLANITDACFTLTTYDGDPTGSGQVLWSKAGLCSSRFGNGAGGDLAYVGTCDASPEGRVNTVELVLEDLYSAGVGPTGTTLAANTWRNPCPADAPCRVDAECHANSDTAVSFDLTVMRSGQQGFFDIAVTFGDVFCSAKLDCKDELLNDPTDDGARGPTTIVAFSCASGAGETNLYLDDVVVSCDGQPRLSIDPSQGPGQIGSVGTGNFQNAIYRGDQDHDGVSECFWNVAVGLHPEDLAGDCELLVRGTASEEPLVAGPGGWQTPAGSIYPVITWSVPLTSDGEMICGPNALDGLNSGVVSGYTSQAGASFAHWSPCGEAEPVANRAPIAGNAPSQNAIGGELFSYSFAAGLFFDPDGDTLTYSATNVPGWLTFDEATSNFSGVPAAEDIGTFTITLGANDGTHPTVTTTLVITVSNPQPTNRAPVPLREDASFSVAAGGTLNLDFSNEFSDPDGDPLNFQFFGAPGFVNADGTGAASINPGPSQAGNYTFQVRAFDGALPSTMLTVHLEVTGGSGPNNPPATPQGTFINVDLDEDSFTDIYSDYYFQDPDTIDGDSLTYQVTEDINWVYFDYNQPNGAPVYAALAPLGSAASSPYFMTIVATDTHGASATVQLQLNVHSVGSENQPPNGSGASLSGAHAGEPYGVDLSSYVFDPEGDPLTYTLTGGSLPQGVSLDSSMGFISGLPVGGTNTYYFTVSVTDGFHPAVPLTFDLYVYNDAPVATPFPVSGYEGDVIEIDLRQHVTDNEGDTLYFQPQDSAYQFQRIGNYILLYPDYNQAGFSDFWFTVSDGFNGLVDVFVPVTVYDTDRPIVLGPGPYSMGSVYEGGYGTFDLTTAVIDPDGGVVDCSVYPTDSVVYRSNPYITDSILVYSPSYEAAGSRRLPIHCTDMLGTTIDFEVEVEVQNVNQPPEATNSVVSLDVYVDDFNDGTLDYDLGAQLNDPDWFYNGDDRDPARDRLTLSLNGAPSWVTTVWSPSTDSETTVRIEPPSDTASGNYDFEVFVYDEAGSSVLVSISLTVHTNRTPRLVGADVVGEQIERLVHEATPFAENFSDYFQDLDGDPLTYEVLDGLPSWMTSFDAYIEGTRPTYPSPDANDYTVAIRAMDPMGNSVVLYVYLRWPGN